MKTRTGNYPIGFRRGGGEWQADLGSLLTWAATNELEVIDLGADGDQTIPVVQRAGLRVGSVNLPNSRGMISADTGKRSEAVAQNAEYVGACAKHGAVNHFLAMVPEDPSLPREKNFGYMTESFAQLAVTLEESGARIVIEGWPAPGALCCTPEGLRAFFKEVPSPAMGINYDPSHLIRMNIDHLRFLDEFGARVYHVHGKDTALLTENLYEFGSEQPPTFAKPVPYGGMHWRYTIPGHGVTRWVEVFRKLESSGYNGCVSIELEDANFYRQPEAEQAGIIAGAAFLTGC